MKNYHDDDNDGDHEHEDEDYDDDNDDDDVDGVGDACDYEQYHHDGDHDGITTARTKMIQYDYHDDYDAAYEHDEYEGY